MKALLALVLTLALAMGWGGASLASADGRATVNLTSPVISPGTPDETGFIMGPTLLLAVAPQGSTLLTATIIGPVILPPNPVFAPSPVIEINGPR